MNLDAERWLRVEALFQQALDLPADARAAFLRAECGADRALLADVLGMLEADARGGSILDRGLPAVADEVLGGPAVAPRTLGSYRLLHVLGEGGMGVVFLAERADLGSRAAIKILRDASLSPARRERFASEQRTLAGLTHPHIAQLHDAATLPDGTPYFVMEYVEGVPLTTWCTERGLSAAERLRLFRDLCDAVQFAHRHLIVHRDLKPSNVLVNSDGAVKLLDFGIAKHLENVDAPADQTQTGLRVMTPSHAAPEQIRGEPVGTYTDVYALGVILYELLTDSVPFDPTQRSPGELEAVILGREPERPSVMARRTSAALPGTRLAAPPQAVRGRAAWADLDVLCLTAMQQDPQRRYRTVEALIRDVDHYLNGEPLEARPDSARYRAGKFVRRNQRAVAAAALTITGVTGLVGFYTARLAEQRTLAQLEAAKAGQVSEYLIGLFGAGDPFAADPDSLDVPTLLGRGVDRAEALADQPEVQAQMFDVLGRVYTSLSDYDAAEPLLQRALGLRRSLNDHSLDVAESLARLGSLYLHTGDYEHAEDALRESLAIRERRLPPLHPDLAAALDELGVVLESRGDYTGAEDFYRRGLAIRREVYRQPHEDLGISLNNLAVNLYRRGEFPAAELLYREAIEVDRAVFGPDHPMVATDLANFGRLLQDRGDYVEAEALLTEALRIRRARLGDEHYETALSLSQLGILLERTGQVDRAEEHLREALDIRQRLLGPAHPGVGTTLNGLAMLLQRRGELDAAEQHMHRVVQIYRDALGERHQFAGVALCNLAEVLRERGDLEAAERAYREGLDILYEVHAPDHPELAHNTGRFGALLALRGEYGEAEPLLVSSHQVISTHFGAEHERTRLSAQRLVDLYDATGRTAEAEVYRRVSVTPE